VKGWFVTFEGPVGSGKSTQIQLLREYLTAEGQEILFTREPGGNPVSEKIRGLILDRENEDIQPLTEALLYAASRAQIVAQVIRPALEEGKIVICDRYVDSSIAYQGYGRELGDVVEQINEAAVDGIMPDLTFLLMVDPETGRSRVCRGGEMDRLEAECLDYHYKVYEGYQALAKRYPERIVLLDGTRPVEEIHRDIIGKVREHFGL